MLWFFERNNQSLRLETRYDNDTAEFVVIVRYPDGHEQTERFPELEALQTSHTALEHRLDTEHWSRRNDGPIILPYGWPNKPLT